MLLKELKWDRSTF